MSTSKCFNNINDKNVLIRENIEEAGSSYLIFIQMLFSLLLDFIYSHTHQEINIKKINTNC